MPYRVRRVLLVASLYDAFILEEDGRLADLLNQSYKLRDLGYVPSLSRVAGGQAALERIRQESFDLVVTMQRLSDMDPFRFIQEVKSIQPDLPVVILAYQTPELSRLLDHPQNASVEKIFLWQGDGKILVGILKYIEDRKNARHDTHLLRVPNLLLIEDSLSFYSSYLPILYDELWDQTSHLLAETLSYNQRVLRQRGRPRVHLAGTYEEAWAIFQQFQDSLLGIISDVRFPQDGKENPLAGVQFVQQIRQQYPDLPVILQSSELQAEIQADELGIPLLRKTSPTLLADLRQSLSERFGFGDLVFSADNQEIARIPNLQSLASTISSLPVEILLEKFHRGELLRWLWARTELELARFLQSLPSQITGLELRQAIRDALDDQTQKEQRGNVLPYSRRLAPAGWRFARIGEGSMGGKARGLAFMDRILAMNWPSERFPGVTVDIPKTLVLAADAFQDFVDSNRLAERTLSQSSDMQVASAFLGAELPPELVGDLRHFISNSAGPLAVRSSSLLEDALYQPFAGIYITKMIPNNQPDVDSRFLVLANAIKLVYASTYYQQAKAYIESTGHRPEEERMAVIIQEVVGDAHGWRFYPDFSGVARSYNYYPVEHATPQDGVVDVALGLGKTVVDGGITLRFTPAYPRVLPQFNTPKEMLRNSQRKFYAIDLRPSYSTAYAEEDQFLCHLGLDASEEDGTLVWLGSTFSAENDTVFDGIQSPGPRVVSFAHILKNEMFPLSSLLAELLPLAEEAMACPVEMEFAVTLGWPQPLPARFGFLQVRPLVVDDELVRVHLADVPDRSLVCRSDRILGNGILRDLRHILFVHPDRFQPAESERIAIEIGRFNASLKKMGRPYILVGPGRWGSSDPWLGIPVKWDQISGAKVMVEVSLPNLNVDPSQGSHFFQNMTSLRIGYFTIPLASQRGFLDWNWLQRQPVLEAGDYVCLVELSADAEVWLDGRRGHGRILKPQGE
jgi:CheY-like chemotaxis protein